MQSRFQGRALFVTARSKDAPLYLRGEFPRSDFYLHWRSATVMRVSRLFVAVALGAATSCLGNNRHSFSTAIHEEPLTLDRCRNKGMRHYY
jgi:hypothetical protein